jgi:hypothetical protein
MGKKKSSDFATQAIESPRELQPMRLNESKFFYEGEEKLGKSQLKIDFFSLFLCLSMMISS